MPLARPTTNSLPAATRPPAGAALSTTLRRRPPSPWPSSASASAPRPARARTLTSAAVVPPPGGPPPPLRPDAAVPGLAAFLDSIKFGKEDGLVVAIAQHVDTGEVLMQAFADRPAVAETLQTGLATFYSRSRRERWCKGETSGAYLRVLSVHADCDGDSLIFLCDPIGPACHTGAPSCWFSGVSVVGEPGGGVTASAGPAGAALPTLLSLERTVADRAAAPPPSDGAKPSWTARLLADTPLLLSKVREEADELARAVEDGEGADRVAAEAADLAYHAVVALRAAGVPVADVLAVLRGRFGLSGVLEKAGRGKK